MLVHPHLASAVGYGKTLFFLRKQPFKWVVTVVIEKVCSEKASFILWENSPQPSFNLNHQGTLKFQRYRQLIGTDLNFGVFPLKFAQRRPQSPKWVVGYRGGRSREEVTGYQSLPASVAIRSRSVGGKACYFVRLLP